MRGRGELVGSWIAATVVAVLGATARAQTGQAPADAAAPPPAAPAAGEPVAAPPVPTTPAPPPAPSSPSAPLAPLAPPPVQPVGDAPEIPDLPHKTALQTRWETALYGFVELDLMRDSTQSYGPSSNNAMLARPGTYAGTHPRAQLTVNNSQVGLRIAVPDFRRIRTTGQVELDFFGVQPSDTTEQNFYTSPTVRLRLFYLRMETPIVDVLAGQYYDLFGWGGAGFNPSSVAFLGIAGEIYHRQPQLRVSKSLSAGGVALDLAAAAVRPAARDSGLPDLELGIKLALGGWRGMAMQGFGPPDVAPAALGLSAVGRRFAVAEFLPNPGAPNVELGGGIAADLFIPIVPARSAADRGNALSFNAEVSDGTGISDLYTGLTGGALFPTLPNPSGVPPAPLYRPNIDPGIVTYDANGNLRPINWWAAVIGLQYYLPVDGGRLWASANASRLESTNIASLTPELSRGGVFIRQDYFDVNLYGALTPALQIGLSLQTARQVFGDMPFAMPLPPDGSGVTQYRYYVPESWNYRAEAAVRLFF